MSNQNYTDSGIPYRFSQNQNRSSWIVQRGSFEILAPLFPFPLQIMVIEREKERPRGQLDIERWRVSNVGQHETYWHIRKPRWFMKTQRSSDGRLNFNPRSLIRLRGIQLAAHDSQLAASQAGLPSSDTGIGGDYYDTRERHPKHWLVVGPLALFGRAMVLGAGWRCLWNCSGWWPDDRPRIVWGLAFVAARVGLMWWGMWHWFLRLLTSRDGYLEDFPFSRLLYRN
jgi:hypothetical protein